MTVVTGTVCMGAKLVRESRFAHDVTDGTELALICTEHGVCRNDQ